MMGFACLCKGAIDMKSNVCIAHSEQADRLCHFYGSAGNKKQTFFQSFCGTNTKACPLLDAYMLAVSHSHLLGLPERMTRSTEK